MKACAKHKVITDNCNEPNRPILACICSTGQQQQGKSQLSLQTQCRNQKTMLEMTAAGLDGHWETMAPLMHSSSCNDGVIQLSPLSPFMQCLMSSRSVTQYTHRHLNPANLESTIQTEWILNNYCENGIFQWRHNYVIIMYCRAKFDGTFYNFSVTRNVTMFCAKNYEKLPKFVKVTAKILSVHFSSL